MTVEQMKYELKRTYPGKSWAAKVDAMPDHQTIAVYTRVINNKKKEKK